jgi:hypothetical protein
MNQIALPFDWPADEDAQSFIVTDANRDAVTHLDRWGTWPVAATLLVGPRKSGRSLLGRIFAAKTGAMLVDDADRHPEDRSFHAWNRAQETRKPLLLIAEQAPPAWKVRLADLSSRLSATPVVTLEMPDDVLAGKLLQKLLAQRGLSVAPGVLSYLVPRIERSYVVLLRIADVLDDAALSQRRAITVPFARTVLRDARMIDDGGEKD